MIKNKESRQDLSNSLSALLGCLKHRVRLRHPHGFPFPQQTQCGCSSSHPEAGACHKHNNTTSKTQTPSPFFAVSCIPFHALFVVGQSPEVDEAFGAPSEGQGQCLSARARADRSCWVPGLQDHTKPPSQAAKAPPTLIYSHRMPFHFKNHPVIYMI